MKLKVTEKGLLIPKEMLGETEEVEITQNPEQIIITTIKKKVSNGELEESFLKLGKEKLSDVLLLPELEDDEELFIRDKDTGREFI